MAFYDLVIRRLKKYETVVLSEETLKAFHEDSGTDANFETWLTEMGIEFGFDWHSYNDTSAIVFKEDNIGIGYWEWAVKNIQWLSSEAESNPFLHVDRNGEWYLDCHPYVYHDKSLARCVLHALQTREKNSKRAGVRG